MLFDLIHHPGIPRFGGASLRVLPLSLSFASFCSLCIFFLPSLHPPPPLNLELQWDLATERVCGGMMTLLLKSLIV